MKNQKVGFFPLFVTVGQVVIFPYYIIWLKQVSLTYTLFAWFFAAFSFAAAWGYKVKMSKRGNNDKILPFIYAGMGFIYIFVGMIDHSFSYLPYIALLIQISLGFLQGYFRAWHIRQKLYSLNTVHHYVIVGCTMIGLSFIKVLSPHFFLIIFGVILSICGVWIFLIIGEERKEP
ncbi:hypothetical protein ACFSCX_12305 [Bacillus salitolerans]|uniref:DUF308 domain-containing protein n=1 Tax=Bacillus salitolerans TaxID=1437434 RepID=A0ABW4LS34_9BACI